MNDSTAINVIMIAVPFVCALGVYGVLRGRGMQALAAGCICAVAGIVVSALITGILLIRAVG
jgi:hypothetical protein